MKRKFGIVILITFIFQFMAGQSGTYVIKKASFSSDKFDEFSPEYYKDGIVYCSNRNLGLSNHTTSQNKGLFKIFFADTTGRADWENTKLFSKNLTTILNDGPVTFNSAKDTIFFSRNQDVTSKLSDISSPRNKLGIFSAVMVDGQWTKIRELRINNEWYNVTTPCLSPDGKKLYFASDKPGGYGGSDLYYSLWKEDRWQDPVNLGPVINTKGNESYPFISASGDLLFASDGHPGLGGKDIFFSMHTDTTWHEPIHLDPPINSKSDDFGLITDPLMNEGYFSSNRDKSIDIYHFKTIVPQVLYNSIQKENQYCFTISDSGSLVVDTTNLKYLWDFGDGSKASGDHVPHCFKGAGKYTVKMDIYEKNTGNMFFPKLVYNLEILDYKQPYIYSEDVAIKGIQMSFDGSKSNLPGYRILNYAWDFRDGGHSIGSSVIHTFKDKGEYLVNMELTLQSETTGNIHKTGISKKVVVVEDARQKESYIARAAALKEQPPDLGTADNVKLNIHYSAESEFKKDAVFNVELLTSKKKIALNSIVFRNVPKKYSITERYSSEDSLYFYTVDQQMSLMATYPAYNELYNLGYKNVRIVINVLKEQSEKELYNLIKINGAYADSYFDIENRLTSNSYIMLDQIVKLMNKYPAMKLEVAVHSDNSAPVDAALQLSQTRAQMLAGYLTSRGINARRLLPTGFGSSKPIAPNFLEKDRKLNRRIDFILIGN